MVSRKAVAVVRYWVTATMGLFLLVACDRETEHTPKEILGCYFSEVSEPIHLGRKIFQTEERVVAQNFQFEPSEQPSTAGTLLLTGVPVAKVNSETGKIEAWTTMSSGNALAQSGTRGFSRIEINACGNSNCFDLPTPIGVSKPRYKQASCDGAFGMP
jgi:hypothetical protein